MVDLNAHDKDENVDAQSSSRKFSKPRNSLFGEGKSRKRMSLDEEAVVEFHAQDSPLMKSSSPLMKSSSPITRTSVV